MNNEDVIRMAREAGCIPRRHPEYDNDIQVFATPDVLERFAALIAATEREACAKVLDDWKKHNWTFEDCAAVIRARGEK